MTDTIDNLECPACGKKMKKVYLNSEEFFVDVCLDGCGGIWFDNRELKKVDEQNEDISELEEAFKGKTFKKADSNESRICPLCKKAMVKNFVSAKKQIQIDECYACGGKFFDFNELQEMRGQYSNDEERIADIKNLSKDSSAMEEMLNILLSKDGMDY